MSPRSEILSVWKESIRLQHSNTAILPRKRQRVVHYHGRSGIVKIYTQQEIQTYVSERRTK